MPPRQYRSVIVHSDQSSGKGGFLFKVNPDATAGNPYDPYLNDILPQGKDLDYYEHLRWLDHVDDKDLSLPLLHAKLKMMADRVAYHIDRLESMYLSGVSNRRTSFETPPQLRNKGF